MTEITLQIEDSLVQAYGRAAIERVMQSQLKKMALKRAAHEILSDLDQYDPLSDPEWKMARQRAKAKTT